MLCCSIPVHISYPDRWRRHDKCLPQSKNHHSSLGFTSICSHRAADSCCSPSSSTRLWCSAPASRRSNEPSTIAAAVGPFTWQRLGNHRPFACVGRTSWSRAPNTSCGRCTQKSACMALHHLLSAVFTVLYLGALTALMCASPDVVSAERSRVALSRLPLALCGKPHDTAR